MIGNNKRTADKRGWREGAKVKQILRFTRNKARVARIVRDKVVVTTLVNSKSGSKPGHTQREEVMAKFKVEYSGKYGQWFEKFFQDLEAATWFVQKQLQYGNDAEVVFN